jgi:hypothetical protein
MPIRKAPSKKRGATKFGGAKGLAGTFGEGDEAIEFKGEATIKGGGTQFGGVKTSGGTFGGGDDGGGGGGGDMTIEFSGTARIKGASKRKADKKAEDPRPRRR